MPRVVDHDERRAAIIRATWELIAEKGIEDTSLRDIAREAGYANPGTLSHYFDNKNDLLQRAYEHVFEATNNRIVATCADAEGVEAIRLMSREIAPLNPTTMREASIAMSFWQRAIHDEHLARTSRTAVAEWRASLSAHLAVARERGEVDTGLADDLVVDQLLTVLFGMHVTGLLGIIEMDSERQSLLLDAFLASLSTSGSSSGSTSGSTSGSASAAAGR